MVVAHHSCPLAAPWHVHARRKRQTARYSANAPTHAPKHCSRNLHMLAISYLVWIADPPLKLL